jgi:hypothetical protein
MQDTCSPGSKEGDVRCLCGSLLARLVPGGVELKCRRCRRTHLVALEQSASWEDKDPEEPPQKA